MAWQTFARSQAESAAHFGWASRAAFAARLTSSSLAFGASASFSPVTGETISRASSPVASTQSPATKFCSVFTAVAMSYASTLVLTRSHASSSTWRRTPTISSNSSGPATSGGANCAHVSPRSSKRM